MRHIDTIIIGGGQAGLAMSRSLLDRDVEHVVLERGRIGERWRSERWDSLRLLTPRWQSRLPGFSYKGPDPGGFMTRDEVIDYLERYATSFAAPVEQGVTVRGVAPLDGGYRVETDAGNWSCRNVESIVINGSGNSWYSPPARPARPPSNASRNDCNRSG